MSDESTPPDRKIPTVRSATSRSSTALRAMRSTSSSTSPSSMDVFLANETSQYRSIRQLPLAASNVSQCAGGSACTPFHTDIGAGTDWYVRKASMAQGSTSGRFGSSASRAFRVEANANDPPSCA